MTLTLRGHEQHSKHINTKRVRHHVCGRKTRFLINTQAKASPWRDWCSLLMCACAVAPPHCLLLIPLLFVSLSLCALLHTHFAPLSGSALLSLSLDASRPSAATNTSFLMLSYRYIQYT